MLGVGQGGTAHIICTQPRRIAAIGVAERVAEERGEPIGQSVGYTIRGESKRGRDSRLLFCTTGVLLKMLEGDHSLGGGGGGRGGPVSHVIIDEVHERSCDSDLLLLMCREMLRTAESQGNHRPKLILMSATMSGTVLADYFAPLKVGTLEIEGRTFPVEQRYLSDAIERSGYSCRPGSSGPSVRPEVTAAMLAQETGSGGDDGGGGGGGDEGGLAGAAEPEPEGGQQQTAGQAMVAANRAARLAKEKNVRENSARGVGRLGGPAYTKKTPALCSVDRRPVALSLAGLFRMAWVDAVGQRGMAESPPHGGASSGGGLATCSTRTLDTLRVLDHGQVRPRCTAHTDRCLSPQTVVCPPCVVWAHSSCWAAAVCGQRRAHRLAGQAHRAGRDEAGQWARWRGRAALSSWRRRDQRTALRHAGQRPIAPASPSQPIRSRRSHNSLPGALPPSPALQSDSELGRADRYLLLPLHSELATADQKRVFAPPRNGLSKIVLGPPHHCALRRRPVAAAAHSCVPAATNIAEASVTINDVVFVVDAGTHKEMQYDPHTSMAALVQSRVSVANATQRAGRAGRVRPGVCYHLFLQWELQNCMLP